MIKVNNASQGSCHSETKLSLLMVFCLLIISLLTENTFALENPFINNKDGEPSISYNWFFDSDNYYYSEERLQEIRNNTLTKVNTECVNDLLGSLCRLSKEDLSITTKSELIADIFSHVPKDIATPVIEENKDFLLSSNWYIIDDCIFDINVDLNTFKYFITVQNSENNNISFITFTFTGNYVTNINIIS